MQKKIVQDSVTPNEIHYPFFFNLFHANTPLAPSYPFERSVSVCMEYCIYLDLIAPKNQMICASVDQISVATCIEKIVNEISWNIFNYLRRLWK